MGIVFDLPSECRLHYTSQFTASMTGHALVHNPHTDLDMHAPCLPRYSLVESRHPPHQRANDILDHIIPLGTFIESVPSISVIHLGLDIVVKGSAALAATRRTYMVRPRHGQLAHSTKLPQCLPCSGIGDTADVLRLAVAVLLSPRTNMKPIPDPVFGEMSLSYSFCSRTGHLRKMNFTPDGSPAWSKCDKEPDAVIAVGAQMLAILAHNVR